jgi:hypothetical protein
MAGAVAETLAMRETVVAAAGERNEADGAIGGAMVEAEGEVSAAAKVDAAVSVESLTVAVDEASSGST